MYFANRYDEVEAEYMTLIKRNGENNEGFQIGAGQQTNGQQSSAGSNVNVPTKRWNRFN